MAVDTLRRETPSARLGDRRRHERLEVVGTMRGALEVAEPAALLNVSAAGALVAVRMPVAATGTLPLTIAADGLEITVPTLVRHVSPSPADADAAVEYRVGLEFSSPVNALAPDGD